MSAISPVDFYQQEVLPLLLLDPTKAFPEFDFRRRGQVWEAGKNADPAVEDFFGVRAQRIALMPNGMLADCDDSSLNVWIHAYVIGMRSNPSGDDWKRGCAEVAKRLGVDADVILGTKPMTPDEKRAVRERLDRLRDEAQEREKDREEQRRTRDAERRKRAINLLERARAYTIRHGRPLAHAYFGRRGLKLTEHFSELELGEILMTDNALLDPQRLQWAIIYPVYVAGKPSGLQRVFITDNGAKMSVDVFNDGSRTNKATLGVIGGGHGYIEGKSSRPIIVLCEGFETGWAITAATGLTTIPCVSAGNMEQVELHEEVLKGVEVILVAGDLDKSGRGQEAMRVSADRMRTLYGERGIKVGEILPAPWMRPNAFTDDGEIKGKSTKSVDFDDVCNKGIGRDKIAEAFEDAIKAATATLQHNDDAGMGPLAGDLDDVAPPDPHDHPRSKAVPRKLHQPPELVLPDNPLDQAHLFMQGRFMDADSKALTLVMLQGRAHLWRNGVWREKGDGDVIRGELRRWAHPWWLERDNKTDGRHWVPANLSATGLRSVIDAVVDEVAVTVDRDDYRTQFWIRNQVEPKDGSIRTDIPAWDRRVEDPAAEGLPDPATVVSIRNGLLDLEAWRNDRDLRLLPHTPNFFTMTQIGVELDIEDIGHRIADDDDQAIVAKLWAIGAEMCPEWIAFLTEAFRDPYDETAAPVTIRELMKVIGYYLVRDMRHHQGNITWFHGPPGMGKSTALAVIISLLGSLNTVSSSLYQLMNSFHLQAWLGKSLAVFPDMDMGTNVDSKTSVEIFKKIAGGDAVSINRKHQEEIASHVLETRMLVLVNQMPKLVDQTGALIRRSIVFDFKNKPETIDEDLEAKLTTERSRMGVLILAVCGLAYLDEDKGFRQPKWSAEPLESLADLGSDYHEFIDECLKIDNTWRETVDGMQRGYDAEGNFVGAFETSEDIHRAFCAFLTDMGTTYHPKRATFMSEILSVLVSCGWEKTSRYQRSVNGKKGAKGWRGLQLTERGKQLLDSTDRGGDAASGADAGGHDDLAPLGA